MVWSGTLDLENGNGNPTSVSEWRGLNSSVKISQSGLKNQWARLEIKLLKQA